jgi:hypothetical protein
LLYIGVKFVTDEILADRRTLILISLKPSHCGSINDSRTSKPFSDQGETRKPWDLDLDLDISRGFAGSIVSDFSQILGPVGY